jgi:hypothetical protein
MGMRLESGPAKAERNWQLLRTFIFLGFAMFFLYDGAIRCKADGPDRPLQGRQSQG